MKTILTIITSLLLTTATTVTANATADRPKDGMTKEIGRQMKAYENDYPNSADALKKEVERFVLADDKKIGFSHPGTGHYVWNFKYMLSESDAASGRLPKSLQRLDRAFVRTGGKATTTVAHCPADGESPFHWITFSWPDTYWARICFNYNMRDDFTYRFSTFTGPDSVRTLYAIVWRQEMFYDKDSLACNTIDGYLIKMEGKHWRIDDLNTTYVSGRDRFNRSKAAPTDTTAFAELREKTKYIAGLYETHKANNDERGCDAAVYFFHKLAEDLNSTLTAKQFDEINTLASKMYVGGRQRDNILTKALVALQRKSKKRPLSLTSVRTTRNRPFLRNGFQEKLIIEKIISPNGMDRTRRERTISGTVAPGTGELTIQPVTFPFNDAEDIAVGEGGRFTYTYEAEPDQIFEIADDKGHTYAFVADSVPVVVDMGQRRVTSASDLNRRFMACQNRMHDYEREAKKYTTDIEGYTLTFDNDGMLALIDSADAASDRIIRENMDSPIAAYYLSRRYSNMGYERLVSLLDSTRAYASHTAMQPVWQFYRNMEKRRPGLIYTDVELTDPDGNAHRLSEYVGRGYVLLYFWNMDGASRGEIPMLKRMNRRYKDEGLNIIGIYLDSNREDWANYVEKRGIHWTHLSNLKGFKSEIAQIYGITSLPEYVIIGPDGRIVNCGLIGYWLESEIKEILKKKRR